MAGSRRGICQNSELLFLNEFWRIPRHPLEVQEEPENKDRPQFELTADKPKLYRAIHFDE